MQKRLLLLIGLLCLVCLIWIAGRGKHRPDPEQADAIIQSAEQLLAEQQFDESIEELMGLLEVSPDNDKAVFLLGHCYYQQKNYELAAHRFWSIPPESEYYQPALHNTAKACLKCAQMERAEEALEQFLQVAPDSPAVITELQWLYFNQFRVREAEQLLKENLQIAQAPYPLLYHLLQIEFYPPIAQESIGLLKQINNAKPGQASILLALGYCHWKLGEIKQGRDLIEQSLAINPERLESILTAADFYLETGDLQKSESLLQPANEYPSELKKKLQQDDRWHYFKSRLHFQKKELPQALQELQLALQLNPHEIQYLQQCGKIHQASGHYKRAQTQFQKAKTLATSYQELYQFVASGTLENPTREDCLQVASHLETLQHTTQAQLWKKIADSVQ